MKKIIIKFDSKDKLENIYLTMWGAEIVAEYPILWGLSTYGYAVEQ